MDITKLKYNRDKVIKACKELNNGSVVATMACSIMIPMRYSTRGLAAVGVKTTFAGYYCMVVGDSYAVSLMAGLITSEPSYNNTVSIDGEEYYVLEYEKGDVIITDTMILQDTELVYKVYREIIATGHVPWYIDYRLYGKVLNSAKRYGGHNLGGASRATFEVITASLARSDKDTTKQLRYSIKKASDIDTLGVRCIPLNSVIYGATNTTARLMGARLDEGISASLANPSKSVEDFEELLRK